MAWLLWPSSSLLTTRCRVCFMLAWTRTCRHRELTRESPKLCGGSLEAPPSNRFGADFEPISSRFRADFEPISNRLPCGSRFRTDFEPLSSRFGADSEPISNRPPLSPKSADLSRFLHTGQRGDHGLASRMALCVVGLRFQRGWAWGGSDQLGNLTVKFKHLCRFCLRV